MSDLVTLTIDGVEVSVPKGTLIVEAAKQIDNEIPVFCYHTKLEPVGMCRMCLVTVGTPVRDRATGELQLDDDGNPVIRNFPKPQTACTTPVSPGMVVVTQSEESLDDRHAMLEFLLTSHPLDCPVCDKGGECALQDLTYAHGPGVTRFYREDKHHGPKKYPLGDLIVLDTERCIMCTRCVRFQKELAGDPVLAVEERGRHARIVSYTNPQFDSKYSGNTTDICPVGALTSRDFRFGARAWELTNIPSVCNHCAVGCNTVLSTRTNEIKRIMPRQNEAINELWICDKGRFGHHFNHHPNRLTTPLIRKDNKLVEASWDEALTLIAEKFSAAGSNVGGIAGARLSNEDLYVFQKFFRQVLNSHNIDHRVGLSRYLDAAELVHQMGVGRGTDISRLRQNSAVLVIGSDLDEEAPILYLNTRNAARHDTHLISANGRKTKLDAVAQTKLRYRYGSEAYLVWGMVAALQQDATPDERVQGLDALGLNLADLTPAKVADITGLSAASIKAAARAFATAENGIVILGMESGADESLQAAIKALLAITGHYGKADNGVIAVWPHANSQGAADMGVVPHRLPGYQTLSSDEAGLSADAMLNPEQALQALYLVATNPAAESSTYKSALYKTDFVVVQDLFLTETAQIADVVLPAVGTAERDGSFTNLTRTVQAFDAGILPPVQTCWPDWRIIASLAARMGAAWFYASADGVMQEITREIALYQAMDFANLTAPISIERQMSHYVYSGMSFSGEEREGLQWPSQSEAADSPIELEFVAPRRQPVNDGMQLVAARVLYDGGVLIDKSDVVAAHIEKIHVAMSKATAKKLNVNKGDAVVLKANDAIVTAPVVINKGLPDNTLLMPLNLPEAPAELLTNQAVFTAVKAANQELSEPA